MNKTIFTICLAVLALFASAQNYKVNFSGSGSSTSVGSVNVKNLDQGSSITLNGTDTLYLVGNMGVNNIKPAEPDIKLYPNPMTEESVFSFYAEQKGPVEISVYDLTGKIVLQHDAFLDCGFQVFKITGLKSGTYFINLRAESYSYIARLISISKSDHEVSIRYIGSKEQEAVKSNLKSTTTTVSMNYNDGERLLFKGISGNYSTIVTDIPTSDKTITFDFMPCTDSDGKKYTVVHIGTQVWMAQNLNTGSRISGVQWASNNGTVEKYCYSDQDSKCSIYGALYQWDELMAYSTTEGAQGICPAGWHVPSNGEWATLINSNGGSSSAGGSLMETGTAHWYGPNSLATNSTGFTGLPGGDKYVDGSFGNMLYDGYFWTSTGYDASNVMQTSLFHNSNLVGVNNFPKTGGLSLRCIKD